MKFIQLTSAVPVQQGKPTPTAQINVDAIEAIYTDGFSTTIGLASHNNGGYRCRETTEEVLALIKLAKEAP